MGDDRPEESNHQPAAPPMGVNKRGMVTAAMATAPMMAAQAAFSGYAQAQDCPPEICNPPSPCPPTVCQPPAPVPPSFGGGDNDRNKDKGKAKAQEKGKGGGGGSDFLDDLFDDDFGVDVDVDVDGGDVDVDVDV